MRQPKLLQRPDFRNPSADENSSTLNPIDPINVLTASRIDSSSSTIAIVGAPTGSFLLIFTLNEAGHAEHCRLISVAVRLTVATRTNYSLMDRITIGT